MARHVNHQTQLDMLIDHLVRYKTITKMEAQRDYGIERLGARIHDLKSKYGYKIKSDLLVSNAGKRYAEYTLID